MLNQNRQIKPLDDRPKTRSEIADLIRDMMNNDEYGNNEKEKSVKVSLDNFSA